MPRLAELAVSRRWSHRRPCARRAMASQTPGWGTWIPCICKLGPTSLLPSSSGSRREHSSISPPLPDSACAASLSLRMTSWGLASARRGDRGVWPSSRMGLPHFIVLRANLFLFVAVVDLIRLLPILCCHHLLLHVVAQLTIIWSYGIQTLIGYHPGRPKPELSGGRSFGLPLIQMDIM